MRHGGSRRLQLLAQRAWEQIAGHDRAWRRRRAVNVSAAMAGKCRCCVQPASGPGRRSNPFGPNQRDTRRAAADANRYSRGRVATKRNTRNPWPTHRGVCPPSSARARSASSILRDVDPHRARFLAGPAQAARLRKIGPRPEAERARRVHRADRPRIDAAVRVAADLLVDRAGVQARSAADAVEDLLELGAEHVRAAVVHEHDVHLGRAVRIVGAPRTGDDVGVDREGLAGATAGEDPQRHRQVGGSRHDPLDAHQGHVQARHRRRQPAVALVLDEAQAAALGDGEVHAADAHVGGEELGAQHASGEGRHLRDVGDVGVTGSQLATERLGDLFLRLVDDRRDDVRRHVLVELDDVLAEVGLHHPHVRGLERVVQLDLLGHHRLALDDAPDAVAACDVDHECAWPSSASAGEVDVHTGCRGAFDELIEVAIEVRDRVGPDLPRMVAGRLAIGDERRWPACARPPSASSRDRGPSAAAGRRSPAGPACRTAMAPRGSCRAAREDVGDVPHAHRPAPADPGRPACASRSSRR